MKSLRLHGHDSKTENLFYEDSSAPNLQAGDALVRVYACAITKSELSWTEVHQNFDGSKREFVIPGHEISGVIEAMPDEMDNLKVGDEIYGLIDFDRQGGAAEFAAVSAADLSLKPLKLNFVQSAAVPLAGLTAWQALFDHAQISGGQKILIHGAAGGVGSFAVQFARWAGAYVICTARAEDKEFLLELGADEVIDYEKIKFEEVIKNVDVIFDTVGSETLERSWQVVRAGGTLVTVGENRISKADDWSVRGIYFIVKPNRMQLAEIRQLIDRGEVKSIINKIYPLDEGRAAFERVEGGPNRGKIVLQVD